MSIPTALVAQPGFWLYFGVSRTLNVTYVRPISVGTTILIDYKAVYIGKQVASLRGVMLRKIDEEVLATYELGKMNTEALLSKLSVASNGGAVNVDLC